MLVRVESQEWYPVYVEREGEDPPTEATPRDVIDLPDDLVERLRASVVEFHSVQRAIRDAFAERTRIEREQKHRAFIETRRVARGPGRVRRRPRPNT